MKYLVLLRREKAGYTALVPALPGCKTTGITEEEALAKVQTRIAQTLAGTKAVAVEIDTAPAFPADHPWTPFAGMWKDDQSFEDFLAEVETARRAAGAEDEAA